MGTAHSKLLERGRAFRRALTETDRAEVVQARTLFQLASLLPAVLYYLRIGHRDRPPKFPATISWTIRAGLPKWLHYVIWSGGWARMYAIFQRRGDGFAKRFAQQMYATGVITTMLASLGKSEILDAIHFVGAAAYMIDHHILFYYLNTKRIYRHTFYWSFAALVYFLEQAKKMGVTSEGGPNASAVREALLAKMTPAQRRKLWWIEAGIMLFENAMFVGFVAGMASGLTDDLGPALEDSSAATDDDDDGDRKNE